ncbi:MAG: 2-oxo-4-hydroxy-4-carboxy-5-ureidoimidazoline decarboxylase [Thermohalobaculum sp.]|nr:2-oxo-4-hydroxy-4-carboxy-5-ureidoimidazoline decarboxylase [Thermohalobaculum sp.]
MSDGPARFRRLPPSALDRAGFLARYGGVYEHSPWIAAAVWDAGRAADAVDAMADAMATVAEAAPRADRIALLRAHPDLAGRLALAGGLTAASAAEQAGAGLDRCTPDELATFRRLNAAYVARFGFPFIVAVRGLDRAAILARLEARLGNGPEAEFREAMAQVHRIARLRLEALAAEAF